jgi:hypothetical protein
LVLSHLDFPPYPASFGGRLHPIPLAAIVKEINILKAR